MLSNTTDQWSIKQAHLPLVVQAWGEKTRKREQQTHAISPYIPAMTGKKRETKLIIVIMAACEIKCSLYWKFYKGERKQL